MQVLAQIGSVERKPIVTIIFGFKVTEFLHERSHFNYDEVSSRRDHDGRHLKTAKFLAWSATQNAYLRFESDSRVLANA